jgi:integrase
MDHLFEGLQRMTDLSQAEIEERIRGYFQKCLIKGQELAVDLPSDPMVDVDFEIGGLREDIARLKKQAKQGNFSKDITDDAVSLLHPEKTAPKVLDRDALRQAEIMVLRAQIEHRRILIAKLNGDFAATAPVDPLFLGMKYDGLPLLPGAVAQPEQDAWTFEKLFERYVTFKTPSWAPKTRQSVERALRHAMQVIGPDKPVKLIANTDVARFRDVLGKLPPNFSKMKQFNGLSLSEIASKNDTGATLSPKSQKKDLEFLHAFLSWATEEGYVDKQPGAKIKVAAKKKGPKGKDRFPYSVKQLTAIFSSPIYTGCKSESRRSAPGHEIIRDGKYWIPLIAVYSGLRLGEIVQLLHEDIRTEDGVTFFDVTKDAEDEEDDKQVKTESSYRQVPIHKRLIELGFLDHVSKAESGARVFEDIKQGQDGYYSHNFSKFWGRYARQIGVYQTKTAFHSFRHNFKDALTNAGVSEVISKALMGHSEGSVHSGYGIGPNLAVLKAAIDQITVPGAL